MIERHRMDMSGDKQQDLAPIALFVFKRPEHTLRVIASLATNEEWMVSPLYIFCDGPRDDRDVTAVEQTREIVRELHHPRKTVIERSGNQGLARSIIHGVSDMVMQYGRVIVVEDDLVVSSAFLSYMNAALNRYEADRRVMQVSGHMFPVDLEGFGEAVFLPFTTTWGWGTWKRAWNGGLRRTGEALECLGDFDWRWRFDLDGAYPYARMLADQMRGHRDSWGIWWYYTVFRAGGLAVYPTKTLVSNEGFDGSGTHCQPASGHRDAPLGTARPTAFPDVREMPEVFRLVRDYIKRGRGLPRRVKDRWLRRFPVLPNLTEP